MEHEHQSAPEVEEQTDLKVIEPKKFKVLLLNDDYSTMDFVVDVLMNIFSKQFDEAVNIMLKVHREGKGLCGIFPYDIAETKVTQVKQAAKQNGFPLRAVMEEI